MNFLELIKNGSQLLKAKKIESHILDSELIASFVLNRSRENILINSKEKVQSNEISFLINS